MNMACRRTIVSLWDFSQCICFCSCFSGESQVFYCASDFHDRMVLIFFVIVQHDVICLSVEFKASSWSFRIGIHVKTCFCLMWSVCCRFDCVQSVRIHDILVHDYMPFTTYSYIQSKRIYGLLCIYLHVCKYLFSCFVSYIVYYFV